MEREAALCILAAVLFGVTQGLAATAVLAWYVRDADDDGPAEMRARWLLVGPSFAGLVVIFFLVGWALQEPDPANERLAEGLFIPAAGMGIVVARAVWRAVTSLLATRRKNFPIATMGLLSCRTVVSDEFRRAVTPSAFRAALAHELAHARGRDPLRIWLAQFIADLQWLLPGTRRRHLDWLFALEARRDDEAVAQGVSPLSLAEAVLTAARLARTEPTIDAAAGIVGKSPVARRVRRLLAHRGDGFDATSRPSAAWTLCAAMLVGALCLGVVYGEALLVFLPGVRPCS